MKLLVMFIAAALSIPALSDNHSPENPYLGFYYFSAPTYTEFVNRSLPNIARLLP